MNQPYILGPFGEHLYLLQPQLSDIKLASVAHGLARIARFTGHTRGRPYSVAQHSVMASYVVAPGYALEALMHDGAEYALNDISSPLKSLLPDYKAIEAMWDAEIRRRLRLPAKMSPAVHEADLIMLATEKRDLMPRDYELWAWKVIKDVVPLAKKIRPWPYWWAEYKFRSRFRELMDERELA